MIKIHLANESKQNIGGGFTFMQNLVESVNLINSDVKFTDYAECDIYFITSASMITRDSIKLAKEDGKKILLRVDNIPRNSRNRNTGTTRLYDFAQLADHVIFQSEWAKRKVMPLLDSNTIDISTEHNSYMYGIDDRAKYFCECNSSIIMNGVNTHIFNKEVDGIDNPHKKRFLIVRYNRDNNKRLEEALDMYSEKWLIDTDIDLYVVGQYSRELVSGYFDFFMGERFTMHGVVTDRKQLASLYRSCDVLIYPSYSDACPNTITEALACGLEVWHNNHAGIPEIMEAYKNGGTEWLSLERMGTEYLNLFKKVL